MKFIYIQAIKCGNKIEIPYRITIGDSQSEDSLTSLLIRPEKHISKQVYEKHHLNRTELLCAPPFCDIADELIELLQEEVLVFSERKQFLILKARFKSIGYNFNATPRILWRSPKDETGDDPEADVQKSASLGLHSVQFAELFVQYMATIAREAKTTTLRPDTAAQNANCPDLSSFKPTPGVYFFMDSDKEVLYVGKAKNVKRRLRGHFSNQTGGKLNYARVSSIHVDYTGNDIVAQLIESHQIKTLKPVFNTQQVSDAAPFIINRGETAKGIFRLKITRKDIQDNMPEKYFNRLSVRQSLEEFCTTYHLCRKHCGLETVKGPCNNVTARHKACVCAGGESIAQYNDRFAEAFALFEKKRSRCIYKLKGRTAGEDAFVYTVNGIYQGYGFIGVEDNIRTENDILAHLNSMPNNYDTTRIVSALTKRILKENVLVLE